MKFIGIILLLSFSVSAQSQIKGEVELAGFILGQYRKAVHTQLGPPVQRIDTDDGWIYEFHKIRPDTSVYALFKYSSSDTLRIYAIQLNGHTYEEMHPFYGLRLGDDRLHVYEALGEFHTTDTIDNPKVFIQVYNNTNYSVEIDEQHKLYGIQIFGSILQNEPENTLADISGFQRAIHLKNTDSLLRHMAPDVELYVNDNIITYQGSARMEFFNSKSEVVKYLLGPKNSVWFAFEKEKSEALSEFRFVPGQRLMTVFKYPKSKILEEIVFIQHAGQWKVYEIKFR